MVAARADLFRLLGDEGRLRLLALCAEEELTVGELASLLGESQPQITKKSQPLREAGLLAARRDGTRTLLRSQVYSKGARPLPTGTAGEVPSPASVASSLDAEATSAADPVIGAALEEGRALCSRDGSLAKIAAIVAAREELSRRYFEDARTDASPSPGRDPELLAWLPLLAPLLPGRALAIDVGTGEGTLLPVLSPLYDRVIAVDRSPARLARCGARIASWGLPNVRLREGDVDDAGLAQDIAERGGADLVVMARVLHHAARPQDAIAAAARLLRPGGSLVIADYLPHDDEAMREQGDVWLGFAPARLQGWLEAAALADVTVAPFPSRSIPFPNHLALQLAVGRKRPRLVS